MDKKEYIFGGITEIEIIDEDEVIEAYVCADGGAAYDGADPTRLPAMT